MSSRLFDKRTFLRTAAGSLFASKAPAANRPPNIILVIADDLGYGDLGSYGSRIATPRLDQMAAEGVRFRQFYAGSSVCSPSRAALLTGRYPIRTGVPGVLWPEATSGLAETETTIARMLKDAGYRTCAVGKWHLGSLPQFLPTSHGFDEYFGIPYSSDMSPCILLRNTTVADQAFSLDNITERFTAQAVDFIRRAPESPFFLYFADTLPHLPLDLSERFRGKSGIGRYADAVQAIDWSVGQILDAVAALGIDKNTLVMFTSDHGPWYQGSSGRLRGYKAETFEGGVRVPFLARWPGRISSGRTANGVASAMDLLPTLGRLASARLPDVPLDGVDIWPLIAGDVDEVERDLLLFFDGWHLQCARQGRWKLHVSRYNTPPWTPDPKVGRFNLPLPRPELYDLECDPEECYDTAADNPLTVAYLRARMEALVAVLPDRVGEAWAQTASMQVEDTPSGAWPVRRIV